MRKLLFAYVKRKAQISNTANRKGTDETSDMQTLFCRKFLDVAHLLYYLYNDDIKLGKLTHL